MTTTVPPSRWIVIAQRNGARAGWINQLDLSFSQEIPGLFKGNKGVVRLDIYNFGNNRHYRKLGCNSINIC